MRLSEAVVLNQLESVHIISDKPYAPLKKPRKRFSNSSTAGTVLSPVAVPDLADQWLLTYGEKKKVLGAMRAAIGGDTAGAGVEKRKRVDSDIEPISFHNMTHTVPEELLHSYPTKAVIDGTPSPEFA